MNCRMTDFSSFFYPNLPHADISALISGQRFEKIPEVYGRCFYGKFNYPYFLRPAHQR